MILKRLGVTCATALIPFGAADAQDRQRPVDIPASAYGPTWTGFYLGAAFGGGVMESTVTSAGTTSLNVDRAASPGILASIYGGVDYQILPRALVGALVEGAWSNMQGGATAQVPTVSANINRQANLGWAALVRAGVLASPSTLLYLLGGYSGQNVHTDGTATAGGAFASFSRDQYFNGWTIGTGLETSLGGGWFTKLEYRYTQFESKTAPGTTFAVQPSIHAARIGLSYKFGGFAGESFPDASAYNQPRDWTGIYVGAGGGASASVNRLNANFGSGSSSIDAGGQQLLGTVFAGYDYQVAPHMVVGAMGDVTWSGPQSVQTLMTGGSTLSVTSRTNMSWNVLGRVGYLSTPSTLLYAAGGYTGEYITSTATASIGGATANIYQDDVANGWTIGPGFETVVTGAWTTRLEYRYSQYERKSIVSGASVQPSTHTIRAGLAYKFGTGK